MSLNRNQAIAIMDDLAEMNVESWVHSYPAGAHMGEKREQRFLLRGRSEPLGDHHVHLKRFDELADKRNCALKLSVSDGSLHPIGKLVLQFL